MQASSNIYIPPELWFPSSDRRRALRVYDKYVYSTTVFIELDAEPISWLVNAGAQFKTATTGLGRHSDVIFLDLDTEAVIAWEDRILSMARRWTDFDASLCVTSVLAMQIEDALVIRHRMVDTSPVYAWVDQTPVSKARTKDKPSIPGLGKKKQRKLSNAEKLEIIMRRFKAKFSAAGCDTLKVALSWIVNSQADFTWKWKVLASLQSAPEEEWAGLHITHNFLTTVLAMLEARAQNELSTFNSLRAEIGQHIAGIAGCVKRSTNVDPENIDRLQKLRCDYTAMACELVQSFRAIGVSVVLDSTTSLTQPPGAHATEDDTTSSCEEAEAPPDYTTDTRHGE